MVKPLLTILFIGLSVPIALAQSYPTPAQVAQRLRSFISKTDSPAALQTLGKTPGGHEIWLMTLSKGKPETKPALALVAGVDGTHLAGTQLSIEVLDRLLNGPDSLRRLLDSRTIYVLVSVNPDAQAQATDALKYERAGNGHPTDDDRDGRLDEDGPEDLNGDGLITTLRIEDPTGQYMPAKSDPRVLVKADPTKGEQGRYRLITEGIDNDKDGQFNEDGAGGIAINRNFTFDYEPFKPGTGEYAVSEPENQLLIDWLYRTPNVYAIVTFGPSNNLTEPYKFDKSKTAQRILKGWLEKDAAVNEQVSKLYLATGLKDAPSLPPQRGDFPQWAYFHYGKLSFSTPGWWIPKEQTPKDTAKTGAKPATSPAAGRGPDAKPAEGADDVAFLKWATANNVPAFVDWKPVTHPDFPGQKVEVGGLIPFAKGNPPTQFLADAGLKHAQFLLSLGNAMPQIELVNVKTETVSPGLTRITADVHNRGLLPTQAELADRMRYQPKLKVTLDVSKTQKILTGRNLQLIREAIPGNGVVQLSWLVAGAGPVTLEAGSPATGSAKTTLTLN